MNKIMDSAQLYKTNKEKEESINFVDSFLYDFDLDTNVLENDNSDNLSFVSDCPQEVFDYTNNYSLSNRRVFNYVRKVHK